MALSLLCLTLLFGCSKETVKQVKEKEMVLEMPFGSYNHPAIKGENMYVSVNSKMGNKESVDTLIKYNMKSEEQEKLYTSQYKEAAIQGTSVNDRWLVWVDASIDGLHSSIKAMDIKTKKVRELAQTKPDKLTIFSPKLYKDYVGWVELADNEQGEVKLHHLKDNQTETIARLHNYGLFNAFLSISGNKAVWTDTKEGKGSYFVYDLASGRTAEYPAPKEFAAYPVYSKEKIFALHFDDFDNWSEQSFGYFDLKSNEFVQLDIHSSYINYFDVFKDQIAVIDDQQQLKLYQLKGQTLAKKKTGLQDDPLFAYYDGEGNLLLPYEEDENKLGIIYSPK